MLFLELRDAVLVLGEIEAEGLAVLQIRRVLTHVLDLNQFLVLHSLQLEGHKPVYSAGVRPLLSYLNQFELFEVRLHLTQRYLVPRRDLDASVLDAVGNIASDDQLELVVAVYDASRRDDLPLFKHGVQFRVSSLDQNKPSVMVLSHELTVVPLEPSRLVLLETAVNILVAGD